MHIKHQYINQGSEPIGAGCHRLMINGQASAWVPYHHIAKLTIEGRLFFAFTNHFANQKNSLGELNKEGEMVCEVTPEPFEVERV